MLSILRILFGNPRSDCRHLGLGLRYCHPVLQTTDTDIVMRRTRSCIRPELFLSNPDIGLSRKAEAFGHHSHDAITLVTNRKSSVPQFRFRAKISLPKAVAHD